MPRNLWAEAFRSLVLGGEPLASSDAVYEKLEAGGLSKLYVAVAAGLAAAVIVLAAVRGGAVAAYLLVLLGPPLIFFYWVYRSDKYEPEPKYLLAVAYALGIFAGLTTEVVSAALSLNSYLALGVEAVAAFIVLLWLAAGEFSAEFNDHMDGLVYGAAVGLGLVTVYNYTFLELASSQAGLYAELIPSIPLAALALVNTAIVAVAAIMGRWLGWVKALKGEVSLKDGLPGLAVYIVLRALLGIAQSLSPFYLSVAAAALLLAYYWATAWRYVKEALRDERLWGYARGRAPVER